MAKRSKEPLFWALGVIIAIICGSVLYGILSERSRVVEGLRIARVAIDKEDLKAVNAMLKANTPTDEILVNWQYQGLVRTLRELNDNFPVKSHWTYIMNPGESQGLATLSVLTIPVVPGDPTTLPGFKYPTSNYPALKEALYTDQEIVVSSYLWDEVYRVITRSGFIKIMDGPNLIGVLAVDLESSQLLWLIFNTIFYTLIVSSIITLVMMRVTNIFFGVSVREMEIINACLDSETFDVQKLSRKS